MQVGYCLINAGEASPMHLWPIKSWESPGTVENIDKVYKSSTMLRSLKSEDFFKKVN